MQVLFGELLGLDRKSTRLNSSHVSNSYAVFCLKKKKKEKSDHCHDGQRDGNDRRGKVHGQQLEIIENEPDEEPGDTKQDDFHYAFPPLISASSSATRARSCSSSVVADFSPPVCSCE